MKWSQGSPLEDSYFGVLLFANQSTSLLLAPVRGSLFTEL